MVIEKNLSLKVSFKLISVVFFLKKSINRLFIVYLIWYLHWRKTHFIIVIMLNWWSANLRIRVQVYSLLSNPYKAGISPNKLLSFTSFFSRQTKLYPRVSWVWAWAGFLSCKNGVVFYCYCFSWFFQGPRAVLTRQPTEGRSRWEIP